MSKQDKPKQRREKPLKINGTMEEVLKLAMEGDKPKKPKKQGKA